MSATAQPVHGGKRTQMTGRSRLASIAFLAALWPAAAFAEGVGDAVKGVGVVTTIAGTATVARAALPSPRPLQFKDDVFVRDRIATAERSVVRLLLGGKALVTVRELSALTITEETGRATVDLTAGKIAMGVLRQRMRPGEVIEIRTPNAIAAIRGTVLVVELIPEPGGAAGAAPRYTTKVHVLHGLVEVSDPNNPSAPPARVGTLESWSRSGSAPFSQVPLTPTAVERVFADLHSAPQIATGPSEFVNRVTQREQAQAAVLAEYLAPETGGGGDGGPSSPTSTARSTDAPVVAEAPVVPTVPTGSSGTGGSSGGLTGLARFSYSSQSVGVPGSLYSLTGGATDAPAVPILEAANSSLSLGANLMEVTGGSTFASTGAAPLLYLDPSTLSAASILSVSGGARFGLVGSLFHDQQGALDWTSDAVRLSGGASVVGTGASALVDLVGSTASTARSLISVSGGAMLDLLSASAPLLSLTRSAALTTEHSLVDLSGSAAVKLSQMTALTASSLTIKGHGVSLGTGASLSVTGDLFRLANGSTLTFTNGALVSLSGAASLNVTGALINFIGTGNTVSITNALCAGGGCTIVSGLRVLVSGGGSLSLTSPILNLAGNTLNVSPDAAVISVTGGAKVKQGP
ncbi:MAG TPA: FecR domain-containing protein [Methylomirabilota bacterium]|nr:FecR domain-containing protein [Methylomirabilota bacterium]